MTAASERTEAFQQVLSGTGDISFLTSAWQHLVGHEYDSEDFAGATADFVHQWDWDWVKINPRAVYYAEAWGSIFDPHDYGGGVVPRQISAAIRRPEDLAGVERLDPLGNAALGDQVRAAALIRRAVPDRPLLQTVFSPLTVLLQLAGLPLYPGARVYGSSATVTREQIFDDHRDQAKEALQAIAETLSEYVRVLLAPERRGGAGLDGVFFAVTGTASESYFSKAELDELSRPFDRIVLAPAADHVVLLHTCQADSHPEWFDDYGASALQWDQFLPGNPPISADLQTTPVGGASQALFGVGEDADEVRRQIEASIAASEGRPFLLAPSCTIPTPAEDTSLRVLREARAGS